MRTTTIATTNFGHTLPPAFYFLIILRQRISQLRNALCVFVLVTGSGNPCWLIDFNFLPQQTCTIANLTFWFHTHKLVCLYIFTHKYRNMSASSSISSKPPTRGRTEEPRVTEAAAGLCVSKFRMGGHSGIRLVRHIYRHTNSRSDWSNSWQKKSRK